VRPIVTDGTDSAETVQPVDPGEILRYLREQAANGAHVLRVATVWGQFRHRRAVGGAIKYLRAAGHVAVGKSGGVRYVALAHYAHLIPKPGGRR
jgi:hypothetical protein